MAKKQVLYIDVWNVLKGTTLFVVLCVWPVLEWGGWLQTGMFLFFLLLVSPDVSAGALAATLFFVIPASLNISLKVLANMPPGSATLVLALVVSVIKGGRLPDASDGKLVGRSISPVFIGRLRTLCVLVALCSFTATAFKSADWFNALCFGALYGLLSWRLRRWAPAPVKEGRSRALWATVLTLVVSVVFSLFVLECGARMLFPKLSQATDVYRADPEYVFMLRPGGKGENVVALADGKRKTVHLDLSTQGIRDSEIPPKEPGEFRIAMLGDSFTMGHAVEAGDAISKQLENKLLAAVPGQRIRVINCGIGGGGTLQELGMLRERAFPLQPDLVILQLYLGNDVDNALEVVNKRQRAYNILWHETLSNYCFRNLPRFRTEDWIFRHVRAYQALRMATKQRWALSFIESLRFIDPVNEPREPSEERPDTLEVDLTDWYPELEEGMQILKDHVLQMRKECQSRGIDFMAYCVPDMDEISDDCWVAATRGAESSGQYQRLKGIDVLDAFFADQAIPHISVVGPLRKAGPIESVYYVFDGHLTKLGNATVAQEWTRYLADGYLRDRLTRGT